jgi:hypothetical protein
MIASGGGASAACVPVFLNLGLSGVDPENAQLRALAEAALEFGEARERCQPTT